MNLDLEMCGINKEILPFSVSGLQDKIVSPFSVVEDVCCLSHAQVPSCTFVALLHMYNDYNYSSTYNIVQQVNYCNITKQVCVAHFIYLCLPGLTNNIQRGKMEWATWQVLHFCLSFYLLQIYILKYTVFAYMNRQSNFLTIIFET